MKKYWESGNIVPRILDLNQVIGQLHAPAALPPAKKSLVAIG